MAHAFNLSTWEEEVDFCEFKASLAYIVISRTVSQSNPVSKNKDLGVTLGEGLSLY